MAVGIINEMGAVVAKTMESRLRQTSSIMENLDFAYKLTATKKGSLESTMKKTMGSTEQAWNKTVEVHEKSK